MTPVSAIRREATLIAKYCGVSLIGFAVDFVVLHIMLHWMEPAWARVISLLCAMHVTFVVNGLQVFRCLERRLLVRQWAGYMASNGFGNLCNYWIFVTMVSTHWPVIARPAVALSAGSALAWLINFAVTRWVVFRHPHGRPAPRPCPRSVPSPAAPE